MRSARSMRVPTLPICFPDGDERQKRRGDWRWSRCYKPWKTFLTARPFRWCGDDWIGNMPCPYHWMIRALTLTFWWTFDSACWRMGRRICCSSPFCRSAVSTSGGTAGGKQRTDSSFVLAKVRGLSSLESVGESLRAALNEIAEVEPDWLLTVIGPDWFDPYVHRFEL